MDKKTFEESLIRLCPESGREAVKHWFSFAEECIEMGQSPDFALVSDKDAAIGKWLDAIYKGICRVRQEYCCYPFFLTHNYHGCLSQN